MSPLVSVCIITYNSSTTIVETLESIKNQTYKNIELIISDDFSKDDTVNIVTRWLSENNSHFIRTKLITTEANRGTAGNLNSAIQNSSGEWIKILAGDDLLKENCIETFITESAKHPEIEFFISRIQVFTTDSGFPLEKIQLFYDYMSFQQHKSIKWKKKKTAYSMIYPGPAWFFTKKLYDKIGGFDENYPLADELPFTFYTLQNNYNIFPIDETLILYRVARNSVSHSSISNAKRQLIIQENKFFKEKQIPLLKKNHMYLELYDQKLNHYLQQRIIDIYDNKNKIKSKLIKLQIILSPIEMINKINKWIFSLNWKKNHRIK